MKEFYLNYYPSFKCIASNCKHTCCAGWVMNIDKTTLNSYKNNCSNFSKQLAKGINFSRARFKADKSGRCAFLNDKGLCEIIINLGENSLCQVCADHPRFRSYFNDIVEMGLGFCCESATRLILSCTEKIQPVLVFDDKTEQNLDFITKSILEFRQKILDIIQDRKFDINTRIETLLKECKAKLDLNGLVKFYLSLARIDKEWTKRLKGIKSTPISTITSQENSLFAEQFLVNSIYRNLSETEDTMSARARIIACVLGWYLIQTIYKTEQGGFEGLVDIVRGYSAEVEYSQKNLNKLFAFANKFIKFD